MTVALEDHLSLAVELADLARHTLLSAYRPDYAHSIKSDGSPVTALDQEIERKLRTPVSLRFRNEPLANVLDHLAQQAAVNLHLDPQGMTELMESYASAGDERTQPG